MIMSQGKVVYYGPTAKAEKYFVYKNIPQVFMLGAIIGLFVSCIVVRLLILMDDSLYTKD